LNLSNFKQELERSRLEIEKQAHVFKISEEGHLRAKEESKLHIQRFLFFDLVIGVFSVDCAKKSKNWKMKSDSFKV
jgi:hypothetical protein